MKRWITLFLILFVLSGCKTFLAGSGMQTREPTPEDIALANATAPGEDEMDLAEQSQIGVGLVKVREADGDPTGWVKQVTFSSGTVSIDGSDATVTIAGVSPGSGSMTTVQEQDTNAGGSDSDIVTIDFQEGFALDEAPDTEINISLDVTPSAGSATLIVEQDALQVKYDSTDFTESTNGLYLGASPTIATSLAIGTDPADAGAGAEFPGYAGGGGGGHRPLGQGVKAGGRKLTAGWASRANRAKGPASLGGGAKSALSGYQRRNRR